MTDQERSTFIATSPLQGVYDQKLIANQPIEVIQKKRIEQKQATQTQQVKSCACET
ncbi:DUF853 domain-containing protein [Candidatus Coxiella mudrowiae]|uniref:DUF853 domain-containing protein n=1 Tax=Candidatus Coxiella mudrowiae TaxID=2054173 RepID=UPI001F2D044D|nr:DUF853 domain-containing protein [Candidatus Coxiella mudrowiae]